MCNTPTCERLHLHRPLVLVRKGKADVQYIHVYWQYVYSGISLIGALEMRINTHLCSIFVQFKPLSQDTSLVLLYMWIREVLVYTLNVYIKVYVPVQDAKPREALCPGASETLSLEVSPTFLWL